MTKQISIDEITVPKGLRLVNDRRDIVTTLMVKEIVANKLTPEATLLEQAAGLTDRLLDELWRDPETGVSYRNVVENFPSGFVQKVQKVKIHRLVAPSADMPMYRSTKFEFSFVGKMKDSQIFERLLFSVPYANSNHWGLNRPILTYNPNLIPKDLDRTSFRNDSSALALPLKLAEDLVAFDKMIDERDNSIERLQREIRAALSKIHSVQKLKTSWPEAFMKLYESAPDIFKQSPNALVTTKSVETVKSMIDAFPDEVSSVIAA